MKIGRRTLTQIAGCAMLAAPFAGAHALGLGKLDYSTRLGEPLQARIELIGVAADEAANIAVRLASPADYARFGMTFEATEILEISVQTDSAGKSFVFVRSEDSVNEPILQFVLEVRGGGSAILGDYTVLLDPPSRPAVASAAEPEEPAPVQPLRVSSTPPQPASVPRNTSTSYGPTQRTDTLWSIAKTYRPAGASIEQMMLALVRDNPDAFYSDNVNRLKAGSTLSLPGDDAVFALTEEEAAKEVRGQNQQWLAYKRKLAHGDIAPGTQREQAKSPAPSPAKAEPKPQLVLSAPDPEDQSVIAGEPSSDAAAGSTLAALEQAITENNQLLQQVSDLEARVRELDAAMAARDRQLAAVSQDAPPEATSPQQVPAQAVPAEGAALPAAPAKDFDVRLVYVVTAAIALMLLLIVIVRRRRRTPESDADEIVGQASFKSQRESSKAA